MTYVDPIIEAFGGTRPLAKAIGYAASTVNSWKTRGSIPDEHKPVILHAAKERELPLGPADFFPILENEEGTAA